jgi:UDP-N-acetylglucosamine 2-epimerase (non-hydrolysing)
LVSIAIVFGTCPEIIKMAPIIYELQKRKIRYVIIHSGQHYSYEMDRVFFKQLHLPNPTYKLEVGSMPRPQQLATIVDRVSKALKSAKPDVVLVQGDTNTVLGGALAAKTLDIKIGHVEAGLRSYDQRMPEETNMILADHCSDLLFAPTGHSKNILLGEGIPRKKIFVTGNTIVDSVYSNLGNIQADLTQKLKVASKQYFLTSIHRQENVDDVKTFSSLITALKRTGKMFGLPVVYPIHPRSAKMAKKFKISLKGITIIPPVDYFSFLYLQKNARLVLTDSGGVQEESCILGVPCVTLRNSTERPETVLAGSNMVAGTSPDGIVFAVKKMLDRKKPWKNPFGDGKSASRIVDICCR